MELFQGMIKEYAHNVELHAVFDLLPIAETCNWYGTEWEDDPTSKSGKRLKPCGEPAVGAGMFCDCHNQSSCEYISVCERHAVRNERYE